MTNQLFRKAKIQHLMQNPTPGGSLNKKGLKKEYWNITDSESQKEHQVSLETDEKGTSANCDCTARSLHIDKPYLCTHIITLILYKVGKEKIR